MDKYNELYNEVIEMIIWAENQTHIKEDQKNLLIDNIIRIKNRIDNEN